MVEIRQLTRVGISGEGSQLTVQDVVRILRAQWKIICAVILIAMVGGLAYTFVHTPHYKATARLFVATASNDNNTQTNDGALFAQRRALTYTKLLTGDVMSQRIIDKLGLHTTVLKLQEQITATVPTDTVLIDVDVVDPSPVHARDIANALADEFVVLASGLETPDPALQPNARVVIQQRATVPQRPASRGKVAILGLAFAFGSALGVAVGLGRHLLDRTVRYPDAVEKILGVDGLGEIPSTPQLGESPNIYFGTNSSTTDAFRQLRTNIQFLEAGREADNARVLVVASAQPGEGKTTVAMNLAVALAEANNNVVIVDANLRRPQVAQALEIDGRIGLSSILTGASGLQNALQATRFSHLTALASGSVPASATELLGSRAAADVFSQLGDLYDYVIVDSPSLLVADAALLAAYAQGLLMVVKYGETTRSQLAEAADKLERTGAALFGSLLTMTAAKKVKQRTKDKSSSTGRTRRGTHNKRRISTD